MDDFKKELGSRIRRIRKERGLTLDEMAQATGITNSALSKIERGTVSVSAENLSLISRVLGVSNDFLLYGENYSPNIQTQTNKHELILNETYPTYEEDGKLADSTLFKSFVDSTIKWLKDEKSSSSLDPQAIKGFFKTVAVFFSKSPTIVIDENNSQNQNNRDELSQEEKELLEIIRDLDEGDKYELLTIARMKKDIVKKYGKRKRGKSSMSISEEAAASEKRYDKFA